MIAAFLWGLCGCGAETPLTLPEAPAGVPAVSPAGPAIWLAAYTYEWNESFGGVRLSYLWPSADDFDGAIGIGMDIRMFGKSYQRGDRPEGGYMWAVSVDALRYEPVAGEDHEVTSTMLSTGARLHPRQALFLRIGLGYVTHKDGSGSASDGAGAELALGWMLPAGTVDLGLEARAFWAKPGAERLDGTSAGLTVYYSW